MLSKLAILLQSKTALAALGVLLVGSGGTAVAVTAASGHVPFTNISMPATHTSAPGNSGAMPAMQQTPAANAHANAVAIEGVLKATATGTTTATATSAPTGTMTTAQPSITSIRVQPPGSKKAVTILVNAKTQVTGQAHTLARLAKYRGHRVQVQADKTGTTLTAWKVTVMGMASSGTPTPGMGSGSATGTGTAGGQNGPGGQQQEVTGTVASVHAGASSFTVRVSDATFVRVAVTPMTQFSGMVMSLSALRPGTHVVVSGTMQADGTLAAASVQAVPR
ncbi:MAG TPA: DUF5666 domain-containing protein [Thermomicrobiales bacterium]|nr:DUF5666 domain-containing protein [Thermomicrobiales bacterium]